MTLTADNILTLKAPDSPASTFKHLIDHSCLRFIESRLVRRSTAGLVFKNPIYCSLLGQPGVEMDLILDEGTTLLEMVEKIRNVSEPATAGCEREVSYREHCRTTELMRSEHSESTVE
jgi:hypothetical protein